jgi:uncharacterized repeat protein (TIGR02543 family)
MDGTRSYLFAGFENSDIENLPTRDGYIFRGWAVNSSANGPEYGYNDSIMLYTNKTLYAVWEDKCSVYGAGLESGSLLTDAEVGAYVTYQPSSSNYQVSGVAWDETNKVISSEIQNFVPSDAKKWRVFAKDEENVEIISEENVALLTIGGEYGYRNLVQILNDFSAAYMDDNYAISARHLGYNEDGITDLENYKVLSEESYPLIISASLPILYNDNQYKKDVEVININPLLKTYKQSYLASRSYQYYDMSALAGGLPVQLDMANFGAKLLCTSGNLLDSSNIVALSPMLAIAVKEDEITVVNDTSGVRPIIKLDSGIKVISGDGSYNNPYVIGY